MREDSTTRPEVNPALKLARMVRREVVGELGAWFALCVGSFVAWGSLGCVGYLWETAARGVALFIAPIPALAIGVAALAAWDLVERELGR